MNRRGFFLSAAAAALTPAVTPVQPWLRRIGSFPVATEAFDFTAGRVNMHYNDVKGAGVGNLVHVRHCYSASDSMVERIEHKGNTLTIYPRRPS